MLQKIKSRRKRSDFDSLEVSDHCVERMNDRNIVPEDIDLILRYGKRRHHGNKVTYNYRGKKVVLSSDETVIITTYRKS